MRTLVRLAHQPRFQALAFLIYLLVTFGLVIGRSSLQITEAWSHSTDTDFGPFYAEGGLLITHARNRLYAQPYQVSAEYQRGPHNYFNPPAFALFYTPFAAVPIGVAHEILTAITLALFAALAWMCCRWLAPRAATADWSYRADVAAGCPSGRIAAAMDDPRLGRVLVFLAVFSTWPVYETIRLGHISVLFAMCYVVTITAMEQRRATPAGLAVGFLALKPTLAVVPCGLLLRFGHLRALFIAIVFGAVIALVPLLLLGHQTTRQYFDLLSGVNSSSFKLSGGVSGGGAFMYNWNGFVTRILAGDVEPAFVFPLYAVTVLLMLKTWAAGEVRASWLAGTLAMLLAMPHILWYDWIMLLPPAIAFAAQRQSRFVILLLVLVHLSVNLSTLELENFSLTAREFFIATPAAFALLAYLAFEKELARWWERKRIAEPLKPRISTTPAN